MPPAGYPAFLQYLQSGRVRTSDFRVPNQRFCDRFAEFRQMVRVTSRLRLLPRITHSGSQPLKWIGEAISLVFSGESLFRAPNGAGSLAVGKRSGCVFHPQGRTISRVRDAVSIRKRTAHRPRV